MERFVLFDLADASSRRGGGSASRLRAASRMSQRAIALPPLRQERRKALRVSRVHLVVEVGQLPAGVFEQDLAIDCQRRREEIQAQNGDEYRDASATMEKERFL